jgi:hypothetical protein
MSRKAPFASVLALTLIPILMASAPPARAGEKTRKAVTILPPADGPAERLEAQPRMPVEVVPLSGSVPAETLSHERHHQRDGAPAPATAHICAGAKMPPSQCAQLAARINRFMSEKRPAAPGGAAATDVCGKGPQHASSCDAIVAQITTWLKARQADAAPPASTLAGDPTSER